MKNYIHIIIPKNKEVIKAQRATISIGRKKYYVQVEDIKIEYKNSFCEIGNSDIITQPIEHIKINFKLLKNE